jgi:subtilisin family serine protease
LLILVSGLTASAVGGVIDADLENVLREIPPDEIVSVLVFVSDAVDIEALGAALDSQQGGRFARAQRHEQTVTALQARSFATQTELIQALEVLSQQKQVARYEQFWIANCIRVDATPVTIEALAARPDVDTVFFNYPIELIEPVQTNAPPQASPVEAGAVEPGIQAVRAPEVWAQGLTGEGILVATLDTGVAGAHPALASRWRGLDPAYAGHPEWAFFDPVTHWSFPQDAGLHGTHTMGTVCGGAPGRQIGVAPGATWISAAVIDRVSSTQTIADAILAFQWLIDPDGNPSTSWDVPHVCSNSWGIATGHNILPYSAPCDPSFWSFLDACEAAGTVILFSAGNEGPLPGTLRRPGDRATSDYQTCAVGGIEANDAPNWTMFIGSSRGPTFCTPGGEEAIKPDISAPAVNVISAFPGDGYGPLTGTSMASPHVNGIVALMLQACPQLTPDEVKQVIYDTALDLGDPGKDNDFGYGLIDAYEAVDLAISLCSGVPLTEDGYFEASVETPTTVTLTASDYDGLPDPPGALTYLITSMPAPGNTLADPGNGYEITEADLPHALIAFGNEVIYTPGPGYYGTDSFQFKANDGGTPPDGGDSEPGQILVLVMYDPPQIVTNSLPLGLVNEPFGPVQLEAAAGQPGLTWEVYVGEYEENGLGASAFAPAGAAQSWHDDDGAWAYTLPFSFPFFEGDYDTIYVCSNGFIDFTAADTDPTNTVGELLAAARIAPFWDELKTDAPQDIYIDASLAGQVTIRWDALTYWGEFPCNFAATLFANGRVRFDYGSGNAGAAPTIGISAGDGANYLIAGYNGATSLTNAASVEFVPPPDHLPDGVTLNPDGVISGTPTSFGIFRPVFKVTDSLNRSDERQVDLQVHDVPRPPVAFAQNVSTPFDTSVSIVLTGEDDGLPDPPGVIAYVIASLPTNGTMHDPSAGAITTVPYTLAGAGSEVVYVPASGFAGDDSFTFQADDGGAPPDGGFSTAASVTVTVTPPSAGLAYAFNLDEDPVWSVQGEWAFGPPTGGGSFAGDPTTGYTGTNVYGYNLAGDYLDDMTQPMYLTTTAIDCRDLFDVELRFQRWLGVERRPFDRAAVAVSNNGVNWTEIWTNPLTNVNDSAWTPMSFDMSSVADDQPTVYVRWSIGPTDDSITYAGWNIDDVEIWGWQVTPCFGDADGDGDVDITDLGLLLTNFGMGGPGILGDVDDDHDVDITDLGILLAQFGVACG